MQCTLRSKNMGYFPRADRGRVNCIHENFSTDPRFRGTGDRIASIQIFDLSRSESIATYCVPLHYLIISVYRSRACTPNTIAPKGTFQMLSNSGHASVHACLGLRSKNIGFRSLRFRASPTAHVPDSETVFRTFRAQEVEVNCVDPFESNKLHIAWFEWSHEPWPHDADRMMHVCLCEFVILGQIFTSITHLR
jgi:hypothetical protein